MMKYNGRTIRSASQLSREIKKDMEKHVEASLRRAADPGVRLRKTSGGYVAEGTPEQISRMSKRLR